MRCARQMWKWIFIILTYGNMNMKRTWQVYSARLCLKPMFNRLKEMKGPTFVYTPLGTYLKEASKKAPMGASNKEVFLRTFLIES